jgi:two-component system C4-dicarboxylate transport response regulator DctD
MADRGRNPIVVIADDDALIRSVLRATLEGEGFRVVEVGDGSAVTSAVASCAPDLLILDVRMPGSSLARTFAEVRARATDLPILLLSGQPEVPLEASSPQTGYLSKPVPSRS